MTTQVTQVTKITDTIYLQEEGGKKGIIDGEDKIYSEGNGQDGYQTPTNDGFSNDRLLYTPGFSSSEIDLPALFGLADLNRLPVDGFVDYVKGYRLLQEWAADPRTNDNRYNQQVNRFQDLGKKLTVAGSPNVADIALAKIHKVDLSDAQSRIALAARLLDLKASWGMHADKFPSLKPLFQEIALIGQEEESIKGQLTELTQRESALNAQARAQQAKTIDGSKETKLHDLRLNSVPELHKLIDLKDRDGDPAYRNKVNVMFRLAEIYLAEALYQKKMALAAGKSDDETSVAAKPDYENAINQMQAILKQFPNYPRIDEVMYQLGTALQGTGRIKDGASYFLRLTKDYPKSKYVLHCHQAIGNYYRDAGLFMAMKTNYMNVQRELGPYEGIDLEKNLFAYHQALVSLQVIVRTNERSVEYRLPALSPLVATGAQEAASPGWNYVEESFKKVDPSKFPLFL